MLGRIEDPIVKRILELQRYLRQMAWIFQVEEIDLILSDIRSNRHMNFEQISPMKL